MLRIRHETGEFSCSANKAFMQLVSNAKEINVRIYTRRGCEKILVNKIQASKRLKLASKQNVSRGWSRLDRFSVSLKLP